MTPIAATVGTAAVVVSQRSPVRVRPALVVVVGMVALTVTEAVTEVRLLHLPIGAKSGTTPLMVPAAAALAVTRRVVMVVSQNRVVPPHATVVPPLHATKSIRARRRDVRAAAARVVIVTYLFGM